MRGKQSKQRRLGQGVEAQSSYLGTKALEPRLQPGSLEASMTGDENLFPTEQRPKATQHSDQVSRTCWMTVGRDRGPGAILAAPRQGPGCPAASGRGRRSE